MNSKGASETEGEVANLSLPFQYETAPDFDTQRIVGGLQELIQQHLQAVQRTWPFVLQLANVHLKLIHELTAFSQPVASQSDIAVVSVASHGFNLYCEILGAGARGHFDVTLHLFRGFSDCAGVAFAVGSDESKAKAFLAGTTGNGFAAQGRKLMVAQLATADADLAEARSQDWKDRQTLFNRRAAHVSLLHANFAVEPSSSGLRAVVGGRWWPEQMKNLVWACINAEWELLTSLWFARWERFGPDWKLTLQRLRQELAALRESLEPPAD